MTLFWTSDHHFGHENIIGHCNRPFGNVAEMDNFMFEQWNNTVGPDDTVFHLGDISHKSADPEYVDDIVKGLNGKIHLIVGNHEIDSRGKVFDNWEPITARMTIDTRNFSSINPGYQELYERGKLIVMTHYGMETWHGMYGDKSIHLHGHSHGKLKKKTRRLDVGVDTHDFRPWSIDEIWKQLKLSPVAPKDEGPDPTEGVF